MSFDFEKTVMYLIIPYLSLLQNLLEEQEEDLFLFGYVRSMIGIVAMYLNPDGRRTLIVMFGYRAI